MENIDLASYEIPPCHFPEILSDIKTHVWLHTGTHLFQLLEDRGTIASFLQHPSHEERFFESLGLRLGLLRNIL
jgi:hypothetical protein